MLSSRLGRVLLSIALCVSMLPATASPAAAAEGDPSVYGVAFTDASRGCALGEEGLLRTTDGGATWGPQNDGFLNAITIVGSSGWAVGDCILHTTDGGGTWQEQTSGTTSLLWAVCFIDATRGWAVGEAGTVLRTSDGGTTWTELTPLGTDSLNAVTFADASNGWVVGYGEIFHTTDGGGTWTPQGPAEMDGLWGVASSGASKAWAVGDSGTILHTANGGTDWTGQTSGVTSDLSAVTFTDASHGWAVGDEGRILHTDDGGNTWVAQTSGTVNPLYAVDFIDATHGWAVGEGPTVLRTTDGGTTWTATTFADPPPDTGTDPPPTDTGDPLATDAPQRISGADRYETAVAVSKADFVSADTVVIATGLDFPDALSASGLCGAYEAPLLLSRQDSLPASVLAEIKRLNAKQAFIVGGPNVVSDGVKAAIEGAGLTVQRLYGANRYETAAAVARAVESKEGAAFSHVALVARGDAYPDALALSPLAYAGGMPILLARPTDMPAATRDVAASLGITSTVAAGGANVLPDAVVSALKVPFQRVAGPSRYETARAVADFGVAKGWVTPAFVGLATGENFPDALAGGAACGSMGGVILMTPGSSLNTAVEGWLRTNAASVEEAQVFGGASVMSAAVRTKVGQVLGW